MSKPSHLSLVYGERRRMITELPQHPDWIAPLAEYTAVLRAARRTPESIYKHLYHPRRFAAATGIGPFDVTRRDVEAYLGAKEWSPATARNCLVMLRAFYQWALRAELIDSDPLDRIGRIRTPIGVPRPASDSAILAALAEAPARERLMIELAAYQGLRCCEIAVVHTADLHQVFDGWELSVHGKGGKTRVIPIRPEIAQHIREADGWVFPGQVGGHLSAAYVSKQISQCLPAGVTAHMLRHRFATKAYVETQHDILAVQGMLGHSSVATTQIYTATPRSQMRMAIDRISA